jgi:hypothetical protein
MTCTICWWRTREGPCFRGTDALFVLVMLRKRSLTNIVRRGARAIGNARFQQRRIRAVLSVTGCRK